jgi:N utilization substance protein A
VSDIRIREDKGTVDVFIRRKTDLGIAIGKGGSTVDKARVLLKRFFHHDIGDVLLYGSGTDE